MILSLNAQALLFASTVAVGAMLGLLYDMLRILRKAIPHKSFFVQIEDLLYWLTVIFVMFFFMLHKNYGEIRAFSVFGAFLGMAVYFLTVSRLILLVSEQIIRGLTYLVLLFFRIVLTPFRLVWLLVRKPVGKANRFFRTRIKKLLHFGKMYAKIRYTAVRRQLRILRKKH